MEDIIKPKNRTTYLDVLKFLGILLIYTSHFIEGAGLLFDFVLHFQVPLFFFVAGCTETFNKEKSLWVNIKKKFITILVPFYIFALASIVMNVLFNNGDLHTVLEFLILVAKGCVKATFFAYSLWFLPCIFLIYVMFEFMKKLKYPILIFLVSLVVFLLRISYTIPDIPYYNFFLALYHQFFFVIGYLSYNKLNDLITSEKKVYKAIKYISFVYSFGFTALLYFKHNLYECTIPVLEWFTPVLTALTVIWFFMLVSYALRNVKFMSEMGKSTLYFCGHEYMVKYMLGWTIKSVAHFVVNNTYLSIFYSIVLLALQQKYVIPWETKFFNNLKEKFMSFKLPSRKNKESTNTLELN